MRFFPLSLAGVTAAAEAFRNLGKAKSPKEVPAKMETLDELCTEYQRLREQEYDEADYRAALIGILDPATEKDVKNFINIDELPAKGHIGVTRQAIKAEIRKKQVTS